MNQPQIGDRVKIAVTGLVGIVTATSKHLHGCDRIGVQAEGLRKDGKPHDTYWFDWMAATVVDHAVVLGDTRQEEKKTGGPALPGQTPQRENPS